MYICCQFEIHTTQNLKIYLKVEINLCHFPVIELTY